MISINRWIRYIHYYFKNITSFFKWTIHTLKCFLVGIQYHTVCHCEVRGRLPGPCFLVGKNEFPALLTIWIFGEVSCTLCKKCSMHQKINRSFEPKTPRYEGPRINWLGHGHQESGLRVFEIRVSPVIMNRWAISPLFFNQLREQGSQIYNI